MKLAFYIFQYSILLTILLVNGSAGANAFGSNKSLVHTIIDSSTVEVSKFCKAYADDVSPSTRTIFNLGGQRDYVGVSLEEIERLLRINALLSLRGFFQKVSPYLVRVHQISKSEIQLELKVDEGSALRPRLIFDDEGKLVDVRYSTYSIVRNVTASLAWHLKRDGLSKFTSDLRETLHRKYAQEFPACNRSLP